MNLLRRMLERLVRRRDPELDKARAEDVTKRSKRLVAENHAVLDDIRQMERGIARRR